MKRGFTIIELIVVISIILLGGFGFANYVSYQEQLKLSYGARHVVDVLQQMRSQAINVELPSGCDYDSYLGSGIAVSATDNLIFNVIILCPTQQTVKTESLSTFSHVVFDTSSLGTVLYFDKFYGKAYSTGSPLCLRSTAFSVNNYAQISISDSWALSLKENKSGCAL